MSVLGLILVLVFGCLFTVASIGFLIYVISIAKPGPNWPFKEKWTLTVALIIFVILVFLVGLIFYPAR